MRSILHFPAPRRILGHPHWGSEAEDFVVKAPSLDSSAILLMGLPRSGTTWLGKIFDSHPDTFYSHEPDSAQPFRGIPLLLAAEPAAEYRARLTQEVERLRGLRTTRVVGKLPLFEKTYSTSMPAWVRAKELLVLKSLSRAFGDLKVPRHVCGSLEQASRWVWKSIESSGRLGALARSMPESRVIFLIRHPCGVAASILRGEESTKFSAGRSSEDHGFFELLAQTGPARSRGLTVDRFLAMSPVARVAWRWALLNEKTIEDLSGLSNCTVVRYEDLCERPLEVSRDLFQFAQLSWNDQTERFISLSTTKNDASYYGVFKDPRKSAHKWKEQLSSDVVEEILEVAAKTASGRLYSPGSTVAAGG